MIFTQMTRVTLILRLLVLKNRYICIYKLYETLTRNKIKWQQTKLNFLILESERVSDTDE